MKLGLNISIFSLEKNTIEYYGYTVYAHIN